MSSLLFEPLTIRTVTFRNRLWVSPMCQYSAIDGNPRDWHLTHYGALAVGGPGLVMAEATGISPEGRITPVCTGIWTAEQQRSWARIVAFGESQGVPFGLQLAHAGRKSSTESIARGSGYIPIDRGGWPTVAPSALAYDDYGMPAELDRDGIRSLVRGWAEAARRAVDAGFKLIEIHGAHGYLIHEFLSPLSNHRTDEYGGSAENRARFLLEIIAAVREAVGEQVPVFLRLSGTDWVEGGWDVPDLVALIPEFEQYGIDLLDISSGGLDPRQRIPIHPGYQTHLARQVKAASPRIPVSTVGLFTQSLQFEQVLQDRIADAVFVGREFLRDRMLPRRAAVDLRAELSWPDQYLMAKFPGAIP